MKKIVIAEDNELNIIILEGLLGKQYDLRIVKSANEVHELIKNVTPDLFLLDIVMSEKNGIELCKELRQFKAFSKTPIVFMSAVQDKKVHQAAYKSGANDFIIKPFKSLELKKTLHTLLHEA
jgi:CheY-like chemotaxis protein